MASKAEKLEKNEVFIRAWQQEICLWDVRTEVYKNRNAKAKSVLELADKCKMTGNYVLGLFYSLLPI